MTRYDLLTPPTALPTTARRRRGNGRAAANGAGNLLCCSIPACNISKIRLIYCQPIIR